MINRSQQTTDMQSALVDWWTIPFGVVESEKMHLDYHCTRSGVRIFLV
jgi:hypothetical protein